ncbi:ATP-binding protein [Pseudoalteromonas sp. MTN2-4]|uniref:ATP-binding protein n=1 Tax=Pseudoalteromonas sp. MTN2-4 TaxID=3056555 RepID=UPI0036F3880B
MSNEPENDFLFQNEPVFSTPPSPHFQLDTWPVLIVDDDDEIHKLSKLVLNTYQYQGKNLTLYHAYNSEQALKFIQSIDNLSLILLDVVMETDDSGLKIAGHVREVFNNTLVRIILRTGQPGEMPEHEVMLNYDINDYKSKTELTKQRLFTSITASLRTYEHLIQLDEMTKELSAFNENLEAKVIERTKQLEQANTDLRNTLGELEETKQQLIHSEKLASIGQLAAGVAHEINTPLGYVSSNMESLAEYLDDIKLAWGDIEENNSELAKQLSAKHDLEFIFDDTHSILESVESGLKRIRVISKDLGHFSQMEKMPIANVDINKDVIQLAINMVASELNPNIDIDINLAELPLINCLPIELSQVLVNLLMNANDAISDNGKIDIQSRLHNQCIHITIADNGCGMEQSTVNKLFDPFFTTKEVGEGTGLGLSVSHKIIESHQGSITVESKPGKGSRFNIAIPVPN